MAVVLVGLAGCVGAGAAGHGAGDRSSTGRPRAPERREARAAFGWLRPAAAPRDWRAARLPSRAAHLWYPPAWRPLAGDPGTASAALVGRDRTIRGYLNLTPRQDGERPAGWARFRIRHNAGEGNRGVVLVAAASRLRFRDGRGSCVIDRYRTSRHRYREIACIVAGRRATTVVVGAALPGDWGRLGPLIERSISSLQT